MSKHKMNSIIKLTFSQLNPKRSNLSHKITLHDLIFTRPMSRSTSIPKNQQRVRDHGYDNYMEIEKRTRKILKFQDLILTQPFQCIPITRLDVHARKLGFEKQEGCKFVLKYPHIFEIYEHPVRRMLYLRLTMKAIHQIQLEKDTLLAQMHDCVVRLRKLLMMSNKGRILMEHVRIARRDFGLPDDFEYSIVLKNPQYFRLYDAKDSMKKYIEIVERERELAVCAVERVREMEYRRKGVDEESVRFSFVVNFPPGFKLGKYFKIAMWKWQRLPYWSPYEDISGYDLRSLEAQKRLEKRQVAVIHELLSLTVEKKITLERIAHFRDVMDLPKKLKDFLLQHQGIFYISTRGNLGKLHTVFLREAYRRGELVEPNDLYLARRKLADLVLLSHRKAPVDGEFVSYRRRGPDDQYNLQDDAAVTQKEFTCASENLNEREDDSDSELNTVASGCSDEDGDLLDVADVENAR